MRIPLTFAAPYYLIAYPDVARSQQYGRNPEDHYNDHGIKEGRSPNIFFDPAYYQGLYPDLPAFYGANQWEKLWQHWNDYGINEGRRGSPIFDPRFYLLHHADLVAAFGQTDFEKGYRHWLLCGINEGRRTVPELTTPFVQPAPPHMLTASALSSLTGKDVRDFVKHAVISFICVTAEQTPIDGDPKAVEKCLTDFYSALLALKTEREMRDFAKDPGKAEGPPGATDLPNHDNIA
jgi:hypothetical protein